MSERIRQPPELPGFSYVDFIGEGGFADVFLYEQEMPRRQVAIKVLNEAAVDGEEQEMFRAEADVMAQLAGHPAIVPIYQAGVSPDRRPYLVMEFCPPPHLAQRFRSERISVSEALETAVRIASAVETAHRAEILHRDVKPHNILTGAYGTPMLTDFGIASTAGDHEAATYGMSIPWSPPEAFADNPPADVRIDVYALAATTYSLLAGRSPFEIPGAANDNATLMSRIERQTLQRINRADVPDSLNTLLAKAMSKSPGDRHPLAMAFARDVQEVQIELNLSPTRIEVLDASPEVAPAAEDDQRTRVRPVAIIVPEVIAEVGTRLRPKVIPAFDSQTQLRRRTPAVHAAPDTMSRAPQVADHTDGSHFLVSPQPEVSREADTPRRGRAPLIAGAVLAAVVAAGIAVAVLVGGGSDQEPRTAPLDLPSPQDAVVGSAPQSPTDLKGELNGSSATFSWSNSDPQDGDRYRWALESDRREFALTDQEKLTVTIPSGQAPCIVVAVVRADGQGSALARACAVTS